MRDDAEAEISVHAPVALGSLAFLLSDQGYAGSGMRTSENMSATNISQYGSCQELQRSGLTPLISRSPCLRTSSSRWGRSETVIRPPTLKALRIALI